MSPQMHCGVLKVDVWDDVAAKKTAYSLESECLVSAARLLPVVTWGKFVSP